MDEWRDAGFQYVYMVSQNNSGSPPSQSDLEWWANRKGMEDVALLGLASGDQDEWTDISFVYEADLYIPTIYHIGRDMAVLSADENIASPSRWLRD